jgi:hypothetical protein
VRWCRSIIVIGHPDAHGVRRIVERRTFHKSSPCSLPRVALCCASPPTECVHRIPRTTGKKTGVASERDDGGRAGGTAFEGREPWTFIRCSRFPPFTF